MKIKKKVFCTLMILCIVVLFVIMVVNRYIDVNNSLNDENMCENDIFDSEAKKFEELMEAYYEGVCEKTEAIRCEIYSYEELLNTTDIINNSYVLYDEYYLNGDEYVYEEVKPVERDRMEEELLSMYGMTKENLYLTSVECEDGDASYSNVRMYYNDIEDIYLTIFFCTYGSDDYEIEVYNVSDGGSMDKLDKEEYGILNEPYAFVSREGTTGKEYVTDFQDEMQYDERGNLVSYHSYGTDINEFQYREGEQYNILDLLKIEYTYYDNNALKFVRIYNNQRVWGTYHSTRYYQYDRSGRCIFMEGYLTHGGDEVFYLYHEGEREPVYAVVFDGFYIGHDEMLGVYQYN